MKAKYLWAFLVPVIVYGLFSFNEVTFDIAKWSADQREACAGLMVMGFIMGFVLIAIFTDKDF
jgi:hypothetical protein